MFRAGGGSASGRPRTEAPERLPAIRDALAEAGHPFVPATAHGDDPILAVHDAALLDYLADAYPGWVAAASRRPPVRTASSGTCSPTRVCCPDFRCVRPQPHARAGRFCYDTMTLSARVRTPPPEPRLTRP